MGLGNTAKKLQKVTNAAEELYAKMNEVIGQINALREEVEETSQQVDRIEYDVAQQRAIVEALAEAEGIDLEAALASAALPPNPTGDESEGETDDGSSDGSSDRAATPEGETTESEGEAVEPEADDTGTAEQDESRA